VYSDKITKPTQFIEITFKEIKVYSEPSGQKCSSFRKAFPIKWIIQKQPAISGIYSTGVFENSPEPPRVKGPESLSITVLPGPFSHFSAKIFI
jgi:hypothetical protein